MSAVTPRRRRAAPALLLAALLAALLAGAPRALPAQYLTRPALEWRTLRTEHFVFHFPAEMTAWTRDVAARAEGVHEAVRMLVGYAPDRPVTVMVEDPSNVSNGFALPFMEAPVIFLWPTPPDPSSVLGHNRGWGEILAVHEFAHVAHLTRPSRNARQRLLWGLLPVRVGPVARRAPRWVTEGYATYVEGKLTGSGRPASAARAAVLRQWALEGQLPTYAQLDGTSRFLGGSMAYLVGSAYLEWLVARTGEESLVHLWRRMTAREDRGFGAAFVGVYGAPPEELYGRFTAELTGRALAVEDSLAARGVVDGTLVQRLSLATGAPALSPDDSLVAVVLRRQDRPSRLVVWRTVEPPDSAAWRARERQARLDPEDVPAVPGRPRPRRALHTLPAIGGRSHEHPRFLPDGRQILVVRSVPTGDGTERPDLFLWRFRDGELRRVTRGAGIREADPSPDGTRAAGVRCRGGLCDLVSVALGDGRVEVLWPGAPGRTIYRPRWSAAGDSVLLSVHEAGRWRLALVPAAGGEPRLVSTPDDASRWGADFLPDGRSVVASSERGGITHLERLDLTTGAARPLTRATGSHFAPDAGGDTTGLWFLALHARGYDVRRVRADSLLAPAPLLADALFPALPPAIVPAADSFARAAPPPDVPYGLGPRRHRLLPGVQASPEGVVGIVALTGTDPVGRFGWLLQGAYGSEGAWRGGALAAELRTVAPRLRGALFAARHAPTRQREGDLTRGTVGTALDVDYQGAAIGLSLRRDYGSWSHDSRLGAALGRLGALDLPPADDGWTARNLVHAGGALGFSWLRGRSHVAGRLGVEGAAGRTADSTWTRGVLSAGVSLGAAGWVLRGRAAAGETSAGAPAFERFVVGGQPSPLVPDALLGQRLDVPALPVGVAAGRRMLTYRAETDLLGVTAFYQAAGASARFRAPQRLVGAERSFDFPGLGFVALPGVRVLAGVAHSLDEPFRDRTRAYLSLTYVP